MIAESETGSSKPRGRPPAFDREDALNLAIMEFRRSGYEGSTMDELAEVMGISKPSIYRAFGDRKSLYRSAVEQYGNNISSYWHAMAEDIETLEEFVSRFLDAAIDWYVNTSGNHPGCLVLTTISQTALHTDLKPDLSKFISSMEADIASYISTRYLENAAQQSTADAIATLLTAHSHSLAARTRAGLSLEELRADAAIMAKSIQAIL